MTENAWLLDTKINPGGSWSMSPNDAVEFANALIMAAENAAENRNDTDIAVGGSVPPFSISVCAGSKTVKLTRVKTSKQEGGSIPPHEGIDERCCCAKCASFVKIGWFGTIKGCINPQCENYFAKF